MAETKEKKMKEMEVILVGVIDRFLERKTSRLRLEEDGKQT